MSVDLEDYAARCVNVEEMALQEEFVRLPGDLAYWAARFADATSTFLTAKYDLERVEARLSLIARETLRDKLAAEEKLATDAKTKGRPRGRSGGLTEAAIAALIVTDPEYEEARRAAITAEVQKMKLGATLEAIRAKKEMIISLGAHQRAQMGHDPSLRASTETERDSRHGR